MFNNNVISLLYEFKKDYENELKKNSSLYAIYNRMICMEERQDSYEIYLFEGYIHLLDSFFKNNSVAKSLGMFFYLEGFGYKKCFGSTNIPSLYGYIIDSFKTTRISSFFIDIGLSVNPNLETNYSKYISVTQSAIDSLNFIITRQYNFLLNKNLCSINQNLTVKKKTKIMLCGYIYKVNFYNPFIFTLTKGKLRFKKNILYTYDFVKKVVLNKNVNNTKLFNYFKNLKEKVMRYTNGDSEYRLEINVKAQDVISGLLFVNNFSNKYENFNVYSFENIKKEVVRVCDFFLSILSKNNLNNVRDFYAILLSEIFTNIIYFSGNIEMAFYMQNDIKNIFRNIRDNFVLNFKGLDVFIEHVNSYPPEMIFSCIVKLLTNKINFLESKTPQRKVNIDHFKQLLDIIEILNNNNNIKKFTEDIINLINLTYIKKFQKSLDDINTDCSQFLEVDYIQFEIFFKNEIFSLKLFENSLCVESILNLFSSSFKNNYNDFDNKIFIEEFQQLFKLRGYNLGIISIKSNSFIVKKIIFDSDDYKNYVPFPIEHIKQVTNYIKRNTEDYSNRRSNWSIEESARLIVGYKIYKNIYKNESNIEVAKRVHDDVRFGFTGVFSPQNIYDRYKCIVFNKRTSDKIRLSICRKICNVDLNRINYEEILIFFELRGVKNVNEEKFLKIFLKAFIYFFYVGYSLKPFFDVENLADFLNSDEYIYKQTNLTEYYNASNELVDSESDYGDNLVKDTTDIGSQANSFIDDVDLNNNSPVYDTEKKISEIYLNDDLLKQEIPEENILINEDFEVITTESFKPKTYPLPFHILENSPVLPPDYLSNYVNTLYTDPLCLHKEKYDVVLKTFMKFKKRSNIIRLGFTITTFLKSFNSSKKIYIEDVEIFLEKMIKKSLIFYEANNKRYHINVYVVLLKYKPLLVNLKIQN